MPQYSTSTPQSVIRQETEPSASDYVFWVKASTNETFFSDGTSWTEIQTNTGALLTPIMENSLAILEIQAADTLTAGTSANINNDIFSDSGGYLNRIDTGNTTALFNTDTYENKIAGTTETKTLTDMAGSANKTNYAGSKVTIDADCFLYQAVKQNSNTATKCYLYSKTGDGTGTLIATATFSSATATFSPTPLMSVGTDYYLVVGSDGGSYTHTGSGSAYPHNSTSFNLTANVEMSVGENSDPQWEFLSVSVKPAVGVNLIIQTNEQTLASTPSYFQIFAYKDSTTGTGTIDADISFDSGANYQTSVDLNTTYEITNTGTGMILKLNLNAGASSGAAECKGYGVLYW